MEKVTDSWVVWLFRTLLLVGIAIGGWFTQQIWTTQREMMNRINALDVDRAVYNASRFSAQDWLNAKAALDSQWAIADRRIFKLETSSEQINKSLERIEQRLGTK